MLMEKKVSSLTRELQQSLLSGFCANKLRSQYFKIGLTQLQIQQAAQFLLIENKHVVKEPKPFLKFCNSVSVAEILKHTTVGNTALEKRIVD